MKLNGGRRRGASGKRHYFEAGLGDQYGVLPLCRQTVIFGDHRPSVAQLLDGSFARVDHRFDGEDHARFQSYSGIRLAVVQYLRFFVELAADTVPAEFTYHAVTQPFDKSLDGVTDVTQMSRPA